MCCSPDPAWLSHHSPNYFLVQFAHLPGAAREISRKTAKTRQRNLMAGVELGSQRGWREKSWSDPELDTAVW